MGKVFLRRSRDSPQEEAIKDAKRAEACFLRALKLFRLAMISNGNEKVVDTLCNLSESRERQGNRKKKSSTRKVRFEDQYASDNSGTNIDLTRWCYPTFCSGYEKRDDHE